MTDQEYREIRPILRAVLALVFALRYTGAAPGFAQYFVMADSFLTEFEMRRSM